MNPVRRAMVAVLLALLSASVAFGALGLAGAFLVLVGAAPILAWLYGKVSVANPGRYAPACPSCSFHNRGRRLVCERCGSPLRLLR